MLNSAIGQSIVRNVAGQLGVNENQASTAVNMAIPAILAGMTRNARSQDGAVSLNNALEKKHDGSLLENLSGMLQGNASALQSDGDGILGHVFGNNRTAVEQGIAKKSGINLSKIGPLLAIVAPIVMAYLGKEKRQTNTGAGGLGDLLGGLLGGATQQRSTGGGGLMDMLGGILDKDGDGNPLDDLLGGFLGGRR